MGGYAQVLRRKTQRHSDVELVQCSHLPIEPLLRVGAILVRPAHSGPEMSDLQPP
jgi:hypothetical protein